jgi:hypothetical protein
MLLSSINRYNDSKMKYLDEYGINEKMWAIR